MMTLSVKISISFIVLVVLYLMLSSYYTYGDKFAHINVSHNIRLNKLKTHIMAENVTNTVNIKKTDVAICVVICEKRLPEAIVSIKSAIVFAKNSSLNVIILAESRLFSGIRETLSNWKVRNISFNFEIHPIFHPENYAQKWKNLSQVCSMQALFLPRLLGHLDSVLYVHTDVLFLSPLDEIWGHFDKMNSTHLAAVSPINVYENMSMYNSISQDPCNKNQNLDSGVMLMNLTRMRNFGWEKHLLYISFEYKENITLDFQDVINILFNFYSERLYLFDCTYNYRPEYCMNKSICHSSETNGVSILHGSRGMFHNMEVTTFQAVFITYQMYELGQDLYHHLIVPLEYHLKLTTDTSCGKVYNMFIKKLFDYVNRDDYDYTGIN